MTQSEIIKNEAEEIANRTGRYIPQYRMAYDISFTVGEATSTAFRYMMFSASSTEIIDLKDFEIIADL